jgi:hypothetical protein
MWTVTRQIQYPDGDYTVEISKGSYDYVNPGALVEKYEGEGKTYNSAVEAVEVAIKIQTQWQKDCPDEEIIIGMGNTTGMTVHFGSCDPDFLKQRAKELDIEKGYCDQCGEVLPEDPFRAWDIYGSDMDESFCSDYCADKAHNANYEAELEVFLDEARAYCEEQGIDFDEIELMLEDRFPGMGAERAVNDALDNLEDPESVMIAIA